jgi:hypothetical protein
MEIAALKEALGDETFTELETYVSDLEGQRDQARNESISGRKGIKSELEALKGTQVTLLERLGINSIDDIDDLPDVAGMAEAGKQFEAKVKRLERQAGESGEKYAALEGKYLGSKKEGILNKALGAHEFVANDMVSSYISNNLVWEGDDLLFKTEDGNLVSVKDGVAGIAKSRPELLKPTGAGGAGVRSSNAGSTAGQTTMTRAEFEALPPAKKMEVSKDGVTLQ